MNDAWKNKNGRSLVIWAVVSLVLVLVPWNLQRRFLTGIYVPLVGLAGYGLRTLDRSKRLSFRFGTIVLLVLVIPTNMIVVVSGIQAVKSHDPKIYYDRDIYSGLTWINENTAQNALVLADEESGLLIPSSTGRRVFYGHPFESVNAAAERKFLEEFLYISQDDLYYESNISERDVDALFIVGKASKNLEGWIISKGLSPAYFNDRVRIFEVDLND